MLVHLESLTHSRRILKTSSTVNGDEVPLKKLFLYQQCLIRRIQKLKSFCPPWDSNIKIHCNLSYWYLIRRIQKLKIFCRRWNSNLKIHWNLSYWTRRLYIYTHNIYRMSMARNYIFVWNNTSTKRRKKKKTTFYRASLALTTFFHGGYNSHLIVFCFLFHCLFVNLSNQYWDSLALCSLLLGSISWHPW